MPQKRDLSQEQIQEIRNLRGTLSVAEAKERYGIGTTRLYRLWRGGDDEPTLPPKAIPENGSEANPKAIPEANPKAIPEANPKAIPENGPLPTEVVPRQAPTVVDFYNRLGRLEELVEQASSQMADASVQIARASRTYDYESSDSGNSSCDEILEDLLETEKELEETSTELEKVGSALVECKRWIESAMEMGTRWAWAVFGAVVFWKVASKTWKQAAPETPPPVQKPPPEEDSWGPRYIDPRRRDPHYME